MKMDAVRSQKKHNAMVKWEAATIRRGEQLTDELYTAFSTGYNVGYKNCKKHVRKYFVNGEFRRLFLKWLVEDSKTNDARRKEFNQAIFDKDDGYQCFNNTDLDMVMSKFDAAMKEYSKDIK